MVDRHRLQYHALALAAAVGVLSASALLRLDDGVCVAPVGDWRLPSVCWISRLTGGTCPGCGLTRAFVALAHGELRLAWDYNPSAFVLAPLVLWQIPFRSVQIARLAKGSDEPRSGGGATMLLVAMVAMIAQWAWRQFI